MGRESSLSAKSALLGIHVVVVDDDPDVRGLLHAALTYCGALVAVAASAREALAFLERARPDVVITDIAMPGEDGYWLVRAIGDGLGRDVGAPAVVAMTAHGDAHGPDRTLPAGFKAHLRKPVDPWEMCRIVARLARRA